VRSKFLVRRVLRLLIFGLIVALLFVAFPLLPSADASAQNTTPGQFSTSAAPIKFWNRFIAVQRASLAGATPENRAERASERLAQLPLNASADEIVTRPFKVDNQDGVAFAFRGNFLFFLGTADLDKESGEKMEQASDSAMRNLTEALQARAAERSWPVIRSGLLYTLIGFVLLVALCIATWKVQSWIVKFLRKREGSASLALFRVDVLPYITATVYRILRLLACLDFYFFPDLCVDHIFTPPLSLHRALGKASRQLCAEFPPRSGKHCLERTAGIADGCPDLYCDTLAYPNG
jgi:hypothetical protein